MSSYCIFSSLAITLQEWKNKSYYLCLLLNPISILFNTQPVNLEFLLYCAVKKVDAQRLQYFSNKNDIVVVFYARVHW